MLMSREHNFVGMNAGEAWHEFPIYLSYAKPHGEPHERAVKKELGFLHQHHKRFIALSPFLVISSSGPDGRGDVSPRGEKPGFVHVIDDTRWRSRTGPATTGSIRSAMSLGDPNVGLLFLLPGVSEILRVNGEAELRDDPELKARFAVNELGSRGW